MWWKVSFFLLPCFRMDNNRCRVERGVLRGFPGQRGSRELVDHMTFDIFGALDLLM